MKDNLGKMTQRLESLMNPSGLCCVNSFSSCETFKDSKKGIATGGISYTYAMETLKNTGMVKNLKVATPHPFPEKLAVEFLTGLDEVLCLEELDPVIERELTYICGKYHLPVKIRRKKHGADIRHRVPADGPEVPALQEVRRLSGRKGREKY